MMIGTTAGGTLFLFLVMGLVTVATRFGGVFLMSLVPINPRIEGFINAMASSVLIAIVVPQAVAGDWGARAALSVTAALMLVTHKPLPSIAAGILAAALVRWFI